jgi:hypothetical protein
VSALCVAVLGLVVLLVLATDYPFSYFSRDPAVEVGASPLIGVLSNTGVLLSWGAAAVAMFAGLVVAWARGLRRALPLLLAGAGTAYLALDDLLLFHDDLYPSRLGIDQDVVQALYGAVALGFLWWFRDFFRVHEWPLLALAGALLAGSVLVDVVNVVGSRPERILEESMKLFGLALLAAYLVRLSVRVLFESYSPVPAATDRQR